MSPYVECVSLCKSYRNFNVLDGIDLSVMPGERVALTGPSGSGKSTLLNCIGGVDRFDSGEIRVAGTALSSAGPEALCRLRRESVATVFQFFHLLPTLSVRENIAFPLLLGSLPQNEVDIRVEELMDRVHISHRADAFPETLSGGEMQRCAIARALAPRPKLLLADEPTGNLDSVTGEQILNLLEEVTRDGDMAMIMVTHSAEATRICDRVVHMLDGKLADAKADRTAEPA